jgi:NAD(P)-dependent dehydrogenase (short-subunit alcohol dehydrogenase family)
MMTVISQRTKEPAMKIQSSVALVTGANRGLGQSFARAFVAHGAKVYAAARDPRSVQIPGVVPLRLDVTDPAQIAAAVREAGDVDLVVNNAGIARMANLLGDGGVEAARAELDTNVFGPLLVSRGFAPVLKKNGGGAIINVLSVLSWVTLPALGTYSVSKAAAWALTNGLRNEVAEQGTQVVALHVGYMDTDMAKHAPEPKSSPDDVVRQTLDALERGEVEVLADEVSRQVKAGLSAAQGVYLGNVSR